MIASVKQRSEGHFLGLFQLTGLLLLAPLVTSCSEPPKDIPSLNPEAAIKKDAKPTATPTAPQQPGQITRMPLGTLYQLVQSNAAFIIDVRPKLIYGLGHIPGAISWPKADFQKDLAKHEGNIAAAISSNKPVVIYCTDLACPDAASVAKALAERGHSVSILQGGYEAWKIAAE